MQNHRRESGPVVLFLGGRGFALSIAQSDCGEGEATVIPARTAERRSILRPGSRQADGWAKYSIQTRFSSAPLARLFAWTLDWVPACDAYGIVACRDAGMTVWGDLA